MRLRMMSCCLGLLAVCGAALRARPARRRLRWRMRGASKWSTTTCGVPSVGTEQVAKTYQDSNRSVAARALFEAGRLLDQVGEARSRDVFWRLATDFTNQPDVAMAAMARLLPAQNDVRERAESECAAASNPQAVASDGRRYLALPMGNLVVGDLVTCERQRLVSRVADGDTRGAVAFAAFSRDGSRVAYDWRVQETQNAGGRLFDELRVVVTADGADAPPRTLLVDTGTRGFSIRPWDWSPDGRWIAVTIAKHTAEGLFRAIAVVDSNSGELRELRRVESRGNGRLVFSPDGRYLAMDLPPDTKSVQRDILMLPVAGGEPVTAVGGPSWDEVVGWSPDGRMLVFISDRLGPIGLWGQPMVDGLPSGEPVSLRSALSGRVVSLTATGALFYQAGTEAASGAIRVVPVDVVNGRATGPAESPVNSQWPENLLPRWSPDGRQLAWLSTTPAFGSYYQLSVQQLDSGTVTAFPQIKLSFMRWFTWSADGRSLLVDGRDLNNTPGIFGIDVRSGVLSRLAPPPPEGAITQGVLATSEDGQTLYYAVATQANTALVQKDLGTGAEARRPLSCQARGASGTATSPRIAGGWAPRVATIRGSLCMPSPWKRDKPVNCCVLMRLRASTTVRSLNGCRTAAATWCGKASRRTASGQRSGSCPLMGVSPSSWTLD